jgi:hypothetical protein
VIPRLKVRLPWCGGCVPVWAVVVNTGPHTAQALYASRSGVTVDNYSEGFYKVDFGPGVPDLTKCAAFGNVPSGGRIANVFTTPGEPTVLYVETFHTVQQEQQNADFHVMAIG